MGYSLFLVAASFLAAQDSEIVLAEAQEGIKVPSAPAKLQPKAKDDAKALPGSTTCEGGVCCDGAICCGTGCGAGCTQRGFLARLFNRGCSERCGSGLFGFLRRGGCSDCDPCGESCRRGLFGRRRGCSTEQMVLDACCRGLCCDSSGDCCQRRGLFGGLFSRRGNCDSGCTSGMCCTSSCGVCCDPCGSMCCNQRRRLFGGLFNRGGNCGNGCCDTGMCGSCGTGACSSCGSGCCNMCGNPGCGNSKCERRILGIFSRLRPRKCGDSCGIIRSCGKQLCRVCGLGGGDSGSGKTCSHCGLDPSGSRNEKTAGKKNSEGGLLSRLTDRLASNTNRPNTTASTNPFAIPHTALNMPKGRPEEMARREAQRRDADSRNFERVAVVHPVIETPKMNANGQLGSVALFSAAEARPVSRNVEAQPAIQLVAGVRPTNVRTAHNDNYSWITGELQRYDGVWVLRYAASDSADPFGGCAVLFPEVEMNGFREGDIVSVRGNVINSPGRGIRAAHYRATMVELIER